MCGISGLFFQKNINQRILADFGLLMSNAFQKEDQTQVEFGLILNMG